MRQMETDHGSQTEWEHIDSTYQLKCDGSQPLMTLRVGKRGDKMRCQGLLAGQMMVVSHLKDITNKASIIPISLYHYQESVIVCDGMKPVGIYCLVQTSTLLCNVQLDKDGRLEKVWAKVGETEMEWDWRLKSVPLYQYQTNEYLLRVQSDRCISFAMYRGGKDVRGMVVGERMVGKELPSKSFEITDVSLANITNVSVIPQSLYSQSL